jgi:hypothetical protein
MRPVLDELARLGVLAPTAVLIVMLLACWFLNLVIRRKFFDGATLFLFVAAVWFAITAYRIMIGVGTLGDKGYALGYSLASFLIPAFIAMIRRDVFRQAKRIDDTRRSNREALRGVLYEPDPVPSAAADMESGRAP